VKKKQFFVNFITIVLFGAVGTLISCGIISLGKSGDFAVVLIMHKFAFELYKGGKNHHTKYVKLHLFSVGKHSHLWAVVFSAIPLIVSHHSFVSIFGLLKFDYNLGSIHFHVYAAWITVS